MCGAENVGARREASLSGSAVIGLLGAVIGLLGGISAVIIGQWMSARANIDGVIRPKLEEAYIQTLRLPSLANNFQSIALTKVTLDNFPLVVERYEQARSKYIEGVDRVVAIGDLYETDISPAAQEVAVCARSFASVVADQFLLEAQLGGFDVLLANSHQNLDPKLRLKESLGPAVYLRDRCEKKVSDLKEVIAKAMKTRL